MTTGRQLRWPASPPFCPWSSPPLGLVDWLDLTEYWRLGLVTNSTLFCWPFKIKDQCKKLCAGTNSQSPFTSAVLDCDRGLIHAYHDTPEGLYLNIPEATHNAKLSVSALEGRHESVHKALQGPETEETTVKPRFKRKIRQPEFFF